MSDKIRDWLVSRCADRLGDCESPIERLFLAAHELMAKTLPGNESVHLAQQLKIGNYRADFAFKTTGPTGKAAMVVVELDGHDFHERTKEQAARDKARDRYMTGLGHQVMRYAGTEVWANPFACVEEVYGRCYAIRYGMDFKKARAKAAMDDLRKFFEMDAPTV